MGKAAKLKKLYAGTVFEGIPCLLCRHWNRDTTCQAFPAGIPKEILLLRLAHDTPLPSQKNRIVFEPLSETQVSKQSYSEQRALASAHK